MDEFVKQQLYENGQKFKSSLSRIMDKYSKLQYEGGGIEVDLGVIKIHTLGKYMTESEKKLRLLESKLDSTYQDDGAAGMNRSDATHLTVSSLDDIQKTFSEIELQPEDQDEELEMSLRNAGTSLVELYPSMISRIGRACHRQNVCVAARSVLRKYHRWRQQSHKSRNNSFVETHRHTNSNLKQLTSKENSSSPVKRQFMRNETKPSSPLQTVTNLYSWPAEQQSPRKGRGSLRERHQPILVMDFSDPPERSLNETFTVCQLSPPKLSQPKRQACTYTVSPSRPCYPTAKASMDHSLRFKKLPLSAHSEQTAGCSMYASEATAVKERPDIYATPVRQSPSKARMKQGLTTTPRAFPRSPKEYSVERCSREPVSRRSLSTCVSCPPQRAAVPLRMLEDSHQSFQSPVHSRQAATAADNRQSLRRHLSFDCSQPSDPASYSPEELDYEFLKLYHKFVCQSESAFFNSQPCRLCGKNSESSRGSSVLAALALSPHRSVLRKRHRELGCDSHPQSKRFREEHCTYSPASSRHRNEMLRHCPSPSEMELPHDGLSYSPSTHGMFQRFSTQQPPGHQETWMSQRQPASTADFSVQGGSFESKVPNGYSPRKRP